MKERLLGAAVLIIAAVILIPTLLDGPKDVKREAQSLQLPVPDSSQRVTGDTTRTHTVNLKNAVTEAQSQPEPMPSEDQRPPGESVVPAPPAPVPAAVRDAAPSPESAPTAMPAGSWAVQVGSFSSESNARRLIEHLKESNYPAFLVRNVVAGRVMFRVRVGPELDRERAEALAERLRSDRQQTQIVSHP